MLVFSTPKPFTPATTPVQLTAVRSWKCALPKARVLLFGNDDGLPDLCRQEGLIFGGRVETDADGRELVPGIFRAALARGKQETFLYLNSDILLDDSAQKTIHLLAGLAGPFLATARRRCLPPWSGPALLGEELPAFFASRRQPVLWGPPVALDVFLFREFPVGQMPNFRIGQAAWDNWMIFQARCSGIPAIDLSRVLRPFHCDHDYKYARDNPHPQRRNMKLDRQNLDLLGGEAKRFHMGHCDYEAFPAGIFPRRGLAFRQRQLELLRLIQPHHEVWIRPLRTLLRPLVRLWESQTTRQENWNHGAVSG